MIETLLLTSFRTINVLLITTLFICVYINRKKINEINEKYEKQSEEISLLKKQLEEQEKINLNTNNPELNYSQNIIDETNFLKVSQKSDNELFSSVKVQEEILKKDYCLEIENGQLKKIEKKIENQENTLQGMIQDLNSSLALSEENSIEIVQIKDNFKELRDEVSKGFDEINNKISVENEKIVKINDELGIMNEKMNKLKLSNIQKRFLQYDYALNEIQKNNSSSTSDIHKSKTVTESSKESVSLNEFFDRLIKVENSIEEIHEKIQTFLK